LNSLQADRGQAIITAAFLIAIGTVALIVLLNNAILVVSEEPETTSADVDAATNYRGTVDAESRETLRDINKIATRKGMNQSEVNRTYSEYMNDISERMQEVYAGRGIIEMSDLEPGSGTFTNTWTVRKNRTTPTTDQRRPPVDLPVVLDTSNSMNSCDDKDSNCGKMIEAFNDSIVSQTAPLDRVSFVEFASTSGYGERNEIPDGKYFGDKRYNYQEERGVQRGLTQALGNRDALNRTAGRLEGGYTDSAGTYLGGGIREGLRELRRNGEPNHQRYMIALSDGTNSEGWVEYDDKYVYSCIEDSGDSGDAGSQCADWEWRYEWGFVKPDETPTWVCVADTTDNSNCDEMGTNTLPDEVEIITPSPPGFTGETGVYEVCPSPYSEWKCFDGKEDLNDRDMVYSDMADEMGVTVYTVGYENSETSSLDEGHLQDVAENTGGKYYKADEGDIDQVFDRIYEEITAPRPIAREVDETYAGTIDISRFNGNGNVTLNVTKDGNRLWTMAVTNKDLSHPSSDHIVVKNDTDVVLRQNYTSLGGTPLDIRITEGSVNGFGRDFATEEFNSENGYNISLEYSASVADVTYDFRVDDEANVTENPCGSEPPCATESRQTVGSIHEADFEIGYRNQNINFTEDMNATVETVPGEIDRSVPFDAGTGNTLSFSTPVYEYKTYYPFDEEPGDRHAFDASNGSESAAVDHNSTDERPTVGVSGYDERLVGGDSSYEFSESAYVKDPDGWNNIPITGSWTLSLWFKGTDEGVLLDASEDNEDDTNRTFQVGIDDSERLIWEHEDENGNVSTAEHDLPADNDWHHTAVVGRWGDNTTKLFVDGNLVGEDDTVMAGKPMQETVGEGEGFGPLYVGAGPEGVGPVKDGFSSRIDDVRLYHKDLSSTDAPDTDPDTHTFNLSVGGDSAGDSLGSITIDYLDDSVDVQPVVDACEDASDGSSPPCPGVIQVGIDENGDGEVDTNISDDVECCPPDDGVKPSNDGRTLDIEFGGNYNLEEDDDLIVRYPLVHDECKSADVAVNGEFETTDICPTATSSFGPGSVGDSGGTRNFIDDLYNDTEEGYVHTDWRNFTDSTGQIDRDIDVDSLTLENVRSDVAGGEITVWVQSDTDGDGNPEEESNPIALDGSDEYNAAGLSTNNHRFRLKVRVDHPDRKDAPRFYEADLRGS